MEKNDLIPGTLDMLVLKALSSGADHGYGIVRSIHRLSDDILNVEEGTLYPSLYRLERKGWLKSEWGTSELNRRAKYYRLTASGRRRFKQEQLRWDRLSQAVNRVLHADVGRA